MHVTLICSGSRGDVQPYLALAVALNQAGHQARLIAPRNFGTAAQQHGVEFVPMRANFDEILQGGDLMNSRSNPFKLIKSLQEMIEPLVPILKEDVWNGTENTDIVVSHMNSAFAVESLCEKRGLPHVTSAPLPLLPTKAHPSAIWPLQTHLGGWYNKATAILISKMMWKIFEPITREIRQDFELPPQDGRAYFKVLDKTPNLVALSPHVYSRPADYPAAAQVVGYWFLDEPDWTPPPALQEFLSHPQPPVYIGFGSMTGFDAAETGRIVLEAVRQSGVRAVIAKGWGGVQLSASELPENIYLLDSAPHSQLFPQMAAVVHHGGAGTTAAGLRAGVPSIIVPFIADQNYWGNQVYQLGVGTKPIPRAKLTASKLAAALHQAVTYQEMRAKANQLGAAIRQENGTAVAISFLEQHYAAAKIASLQPA